MAVTIKQKPRRSTLAKSEARQRYISVGQLVVLEQIQQDSALLDGGTMAIGPFARLDANTVAARDGKSRGAITNLFGSQAAFQIETMALALNASEWVERVKLPSPGDYATAEAWLDALLDGQSERGPAHSATPAVADGFLWMLWLSAVPYGLWSEHIARPGMQEYVQWVGRLEVVFERALDHFGLALREATTVNDLACAVASLIEGVWLNQCLTGHHPCNPSEPIAALLRRSGRLLWHGATRSPDAVR